MEDDSEIKDAIIANQVKMWAEDNLGDAFNFREYQLDSIVRVIKNTLDGKKVTAAELPCGAGKSYIAMCVAGVLDQYYGKTTYILVSDVSLFKQYEKDIKNFKLPWGVICGKDNYICQKNGQPFSSSTCQIKEVSQSSLSDDTTALRLGYGCAKTCKYIQEYKNASTAKVVVMTYQLWFVMMFVLNSDSTQSAVKGFKAKDLVICDEAHKLSSLVQNTFSPTIDTEKMDYLKDIHDFMERNADTITASNLPTIDDIVKTFNAMKTVYNTTYPDEDTKRNVLLNLFDRYKNQISEYATVAYDIRIAMKDSKKKSNYYDILKDLNVLENEYCCMTIYRTIIDAHGSRNFVPSILSDTKAIFNCACEAEMVKETFHKKAKSEFLMSATLGNLDVYLSLIGADEFIDNTCAFEVPSTFNFDKSPIYIGSKYKMSFREKESSIPHIVEMIAKICAQYPNEHGIIHTGSYSISKAIFNNLPPDVRHRIIFYDKSGEKMQGLKTFKAYSGKILMGPSILEGLSFDDDMSRFCIIAKVPYPSLGDNLVKAKMELYDDWYAYTTVNSIIQGVGRSIRSKDDYASTYILDGCFTDLYQKHYSFFPQYFKDRVKRLVLN